MVKASISKGSQVIWRPRCLALKSTASCILLLRIMYRVAPIPGVLTAPSLMIPNWSSGQGRELERLADRAYWAWWKKASRSSDQLILSWDWRPATQCPVVIVDDSVTRARTLYAPIKDFRRPTVSGLLQDARAAIRRGEACRVPESQIQTKITVDLGLMTVLDPESLKLHLANPLRGVRVYICSAMGMPGSETAMEELMCRVLGDLIHEDRQDRWGCILRSRLTRGVTTQSGNECFRPSVRRSISSTRVREGFDKRQSWDQQ